MEEVMLVFMGFTMSVYVVTVIVYVVIMVKLYSRRRKMEYNWWVLMALSLFAPIVMVINMIEEYKDEWGKK